jgi:hypothetical protein
MARNKRNDSLSKCQMTNDNVTKLSGVDSGVFYDVFRYCISKLFVKKKMNHCIYFVPQGKTGSKSGLNGVGAAANLNNGNRNNGNNINGKAGGGPGQKSVVSTSSGGVAGNTAARESSPGSEQPEGELGTNPEGQLMNHRQRERAEKAQLVC